MQKFLTILLFLTTLFACSKSPLCWGDDNNKGIIENSVNFGECLYDFPQNEYIIETEEELVRVFNLISDCGLCKSMRYSMNWVLVPKLSADWSVKFEIIPV